MTPGRPASSSPGIEIHSIAWARIQCEIRARVTAGDLDPASLVLASAGPFRAIARPVHVEQDGEELVVRFNVMQGPGRVPLSPGRWVLSTVAGRRGRPRPVASAAERVPAAGRDDAAQTAGPRAVMPPPVAVTFSFKRGLYEVVARADAQLHRLVFDVTLTPHPPTIADDAAPLGRPAPLVAHVLGVVAGVLLRHGRRVLGRRRLFQYAFYASRVFARRNGRRILFTSDSRPALGGNLKLVHDRMVERHLDEQYELMTLFRPSLATPRAWRDRFLMAWRLARADVILLDDFQPAIYLVTGARIIQLWHAYGAFKTVGYSRAGKPGSISPWSNAHKNYTFATVGSHNDVPFYAEAFGIPEERIVPTGLPRMDVFVEGARRGQGRERAFAAFPEARGRRTILFAPTFRGAGARAATYDTSMLDFGALHELCVEKDAVLIIRLHPFVREPLEIPPELTDRVIDGSRRKIESNDLLYAVDLLITDYSSIIYEFSTLRRPMLFFAYDLEEYVASRDFYEPYTEFVPGRIVRTFGELLDAVRRDDYEAEKVDAFVERHFDHLEGGSTDRIIDELVLSGRGEGATAARRDR